MRNHRGFTLIEILVSLVIMGVVTGSIYALLATTQRVSRAQTERTELQSNIRAGAIIVPAELREINVVPTGGVDQNDVLSLPVAGTTIQYRAMRGLGFTCLAPTAGQIVLQRSTFSGYRLPQAPRDAGYVFLEGSKPDVGTDDAWIPVTITGVTLGNACPGIDPASITLTINPAVVALVGPPAVGVGAPVRTWENMELSLYASGGQFWLGARSVSAGEAGPQPVLGPLTADGFSLVGLDSLGAQTNVGSRVRSIQVTIKGLTDQPITKGTTSQGLAQVRDSLVTQVTLRNALR